MLKNVIACAPIVEFFSLCFSLYLTFLMRWRRFFCFSRSRMSSQTRFCTFSQLDGFSCAYAHFWSLFSQQHVAFSLLLVFRLFDNVYSELLAFRHILPFIFTVSKVLLAYLQIFRFCYPTDFFPSFILKQIFSLLKSFFECSSFIFLLFRFVFILLVISWNIGFGLI